MESLTNKTIRAVTVLAVLTFSVFTVVYLIAYGNPANSLHVSALSWAWTMIGFTLVALLGEVALAALLPTPKAS